MAARVVAAAAVPTLMLAAILGGCSGATRASGDLGADVASTDATDATDAAPDADAGSTPESRAVPPTAEPSPVPPAEDVIRVVSVMGETGVMAPVDGPALAGVVAEIDRMNETGGLLGRPVELTRIDTNSRLSLAERLTERLLREPPDLLVVSCDVDFSEPVLEIADGAGLITVSPCADDLGYATAVWGPRNFSFGAPADVQGVVAAGVAIERYGSTAMVLRDRTSPEALQFCNGFERAFRELGGTVVYRDEFTYDTLEPLLGRLDEGGRPSDAIAVCSHVPGIGTTDGAPNVIEQLRLLGFDAPIVAGSTVDQAAWFADVPQLGELTYVTWSSIFGNDPDPAVNALTQRANQNGETAGAGVSTVLGADSIAGWARAVEAVSSLEPDRVAAAMTSYRDEEFLTGSITFASGARIDSGRTYRVMRVVGSDVEVPMLVTVDG